MQVYLTGFMGSGKTTVGRHLAAVLDWPLVDLDELVEEAASMSIVEIFETQGEPAFRSLEHEALREALAHDPAVVATGGGTLTVPRTRELIRGRGVSIWLNPSFSTIMSRIGALGKENRPLFRDEIQVFALYRSRLEVYARADHTVDVKGGESPEEIAARIAIWLRQHECVT